MNEIIVPVHNALEYVHKMLLSLKAYTPQSYRLVLVDDASKMSVSDWLHNYQQEHPDVDLLIHARQQWFTRSVNDALMLCRTPWATILNSDVELTQGWLEALQAAEAPNVGVVGCVQTNGEGQAVHTGFYGHSEMAPVAIQPYNVDWVTGAVWHLNMQAVLDVGYLDESYLHFESDREWCKAASKRGWRIVCVPHVVTHYWRKSTPPEMKHG